MNQQDHDITGDQKPLFLDDGTTQKFLGKVNEERAQVIANSFSQQPDTAAYDLREIGKSFYLKRSRSPKTPSTGGAKDNLAQE